MFTHSRWAGASLRREEQPILGIPVSSKCIHVGGWARWLIAAAMAVISHAAQAHGIVGNRLFPGTLAFDDPAVMDELVLPACRVSNTHAKAPMSWMTGSTGHSRGS